MTPVHGSWWALESEWLTTTAKARLIPRRPTKVLLLTTERAKLFILQIVTRLSPEKLFLPWQTTASTLKRKPFLRRRNTFVGRLGLIPGSSVLTPFFTEASEARW